MSPVVARDFGPERFGAFLLGDVVEWVLGVGAGFGACAVRNGGVDLRCSLGDVRAGSVNLAVRCAR